ncbi:endonuclease/exonuclease/phosphatase family protein [Phenylobacterium sp.]|uniref:endonuclease/exonuclease/phosphatase family protein n=1 Tax=Phenylobacterium sp. TaxID=1871053 RepID=UPI0030F3D7D4
MRVVAWNCHDRLDRKLSGLMGLAPDIAVVSEVGEADLHALPQGVSAVWTGDPQGGKGLAVLGFDGWGLTPAPSCEERWFLPVTAVRQNQTLRVLGVWTLPAKDYVAPTVRALTQLGDFLAEGDSLCAGDFNQNVRWDPGRSPSRRFAHVLERFEALGLRSVWHEHHGEAHGAESQATHFHRWSSQSPYHIDYVFASRALAARVPLGHPRLTPRLGGGQDQRSCAAVRGVRGGVGRRVSVIRRLLVGDGI